MVWAGYLKLSRIAWRTSVMAFQLAHHAPSAGKQDAEAPGIGRLSDRHSLSRALRVNDVIAINGARLRRAAGVMCGGGHLLPSCKRVAAPVYDAVTTMWALPSSPKGPSP
jgi:hypothetical protein